MPPLRYISVSRFVWTSIASINKGYDNFCTSLLLAFENLSRECNTRNKVTYIKIERVRRRRKKIDSSRRFIDDSWYRIDGSVRNSDAYFIGDACHVGMRPALNLEGGRRSRNAASVALFKCQPSRRHMRIRLMRAPPWKFYQISIDESLAAKSDQSFSIPLFVKTFPKRSMKK